MSSNRRAIQDYLDSITKDIPEDVYLKLCNLNCDNITPMVSERKLYEITYEKKFITEIHVNENGMIEVQFGQRTVTVQRYICDSLYQFLHQQSDHCDNCQREAFPCVECFNTKCLELNETHAMIGERTFGGYMVSSADSEYRVRILGTRIEMFKDLEEEPIYIQNSLPEFINTIELI